MSVPSTSTVKSSPKIPAFLDQSKAERHAKFIDLEWGQRNRLLEGTKQPADPSKPTSPWSRLTGDLFTSRNRYADVSPFAQNRVKLQVAEGVNDYINASPIQLGKRRYIATQGPKTTNLNHFYRMLSHEVQGAAVVVMLTQTHEANREKCSQYYPLSDEDSPLVIPSDEESGDDFQGEVELEDITDDPKTKITLRRMLLRTRTTPEPSTEHDEKRIYHLLFAGWPDFLVPEGDDRQALIRLIQLSARLNANGPKSPPSGPESRDSNFLAPYYDFTTSPQTNPRIIHCSAGVGRSGTFIALDYLLHLMYNGELDNTPDDSDPVAETVDNLRQQRMMMVQGEGQFHFVYEVLKEVWMLRHQQGINGNDAVGGADENGGVKA
ncbi:tyrosine protein phosphatase 1 [Oleoguttula sp. CCFEE 5521]